MVGSVRRRAVLLSRTDRALGRAVGAWLREEARLSRTSGAVPSHYGLGIALAVAGLLTGLQSSARADDSPAQPASPAPAAGGQSSPSIPPEIERRLRELEEEVKELRRERDERNAAALVKKS